jgi:hypothetical protein
MKKKFLLIAAVAALAVSLTGCMYGNVTVNVNSDGTGNGVAELGASKEILDQLGKTMKDFTSNKNESKTMTINGKSYQVETYEDAFTLGDSDAVRITTGIDMIQNELGPIYLSKIENGFRLTVGLYDEYGPNMKAQHALDFGNISSITDESLAGLTLPDLIAQDAPGLVLKATFNMPYDVKQIDGNSAGVSINGKTVTLDYVKMAKSGTYAWTFDSIKSNEQSQVVQQPVASQSVEPAKTEPPKSELKVQQEPSEVAAPESAPVQSVPVEAESSQQSESSEVAAVNPVDGGIDVSLDPVVSEQQVDESSEANADGAITSMSDGDLKGFGNVFPVVMVVALPLVVAVAVALFYIRRKRNKSNQ